MFANKDDFLFSPDTIAFCFSSILLYIVPLSMPKTESSCKMFSLAHPLTTALLASKKSESPRSFLYCKAELSSITSEISGAIINAPFWASCQYLLFI